LSPAFLSVFWFAPLTLSSCLHVLALRVSCCSYGSRYRVSSCLHVLALPSVILSEAKDLSLLRPPAVFL